MSFSYDMDDEYEKLIRRMNAPRVVIDNESCKNATVIQVDGANKQGILLEVIQVLSDLNLVITKAYMCSDGGWFMDVFHVTDHDGNKITDEGVLDYIEKSLGPDSSFEVRRSVRVTPGPDHTSIELIGSDRPGLLSEVCAILTSVKCSLMNAKVWIHNSRAAVVMQIIDEETGGPISDPERLTMVKRLLCNVLECSNKSREAKTVVSCGATHTERRLHQMMFDIDRDYERMGEDSSGKPEFNNVGAESNTAGDKEWYFFCQRGRKYKNILRPNRVTGSGFWKATGVDKPIHSSIVNTGSINNAHNLHCYPHSLTNIIDSMSNQQQLFELQKYLVPKHRNGYGCNSSSVDTSTRSHHPQVPEVHIDISNGNNGHSDLIVYQAWKEYKNQLKNSRFDDDAIKIMSGIFAAVAGQFVGGVMVNRLSSSPRSSWAGPIVEVATVLGLSATLVGITLRGKSRALSTLVIKIGALTIASAIIFSMGLHLPPAMAWTLGTVAFLIMAAAAALA